MENNWKKTYLRVTQEKPKKPTIRFLKEELDYVSQEVARQNLVGIPGYAYVDKVIYLRKHILDNALRLFTKDLDYIETLGYGVKKFGGGEDCDGATLMVEFYIQPCFIRGSTFANYDGEQIL